MIAAPTRLAALVLGAVLAAALAACGRSADNDPGNQTTSASTGSAGARGSSGESSASAPVGRSGTADRTGANAPTGSVGSLGTSGGVGASSVTAGAGPMPDAASAAGANVGPSQGVVSGAPGTALTPADAAAGKAPDAARNAQNSAAVPGTGGTLGITANGLPRSADDRGTARGPAGNTASTMAAAASANAGVADADKSFVVQAALSGLFEVQVSQVAAARASASEVKALATMLVNDHTQANNELANLATVRGIALPTQLPQNLQAELRKVSRNNGPAFDRDYLRRVGVDAHRKDVDAFEAASQRLQDPQLKAWAEKTLPTLRQHLAEAKRLAQRSGGKA